MVMSPGGLELATPEEGSDEAGSRRPKTPRSHVKVFLEFGGYGQSDILLRKSKTWRYKLQRFHFTMYYHWALNRCRSIIFPDNSYMISIHDDKIEKFSTLKNRTGISSAQNNTRLDKNWR
ncbi:hypothetical protein OsJ_35019 [Oryza sativa Japonica Group]|uniref:Uncharacterized protein n=1 Tax=Oryza sativa subsp. japonica TaxID=39947 RepID=B9GBJ5_ORYSJ|nr:hypothetical protein OsJ_35019 [Oryza sativa Japonica Group]